MRNCMNNHTERKTSRFHQKLDDIRGVKGEVGYIKKQKKFQSMMLVLFIVIGVVLFLLGLALTKTRANIFTVLGILMVLPGAKRVIALVLFVPRKSVEPERYEKMKERLAEDAVLLTDYIFTSPDKVMSFDFLIVQDQKVMGILSEKKQDLTYIKDYLQKGLNQTASGYQVCVFSTAEEFEKFYAKQKKTGNNRSKSAAEQTEHDSSSQDDSSQDKVLEYLKILAV